MGKQIKRYQVQILTVSYANPYVNTWHTFKRNLSYSEALACKAECMVNWETPRIVPEDYRGL